MLICSILRQKDLKERTDLILLFKKENRSIVYFIIFHCTASGWKNLGYFYGEDKYTTRESEIAETLDVLWIRKENIECVTESIKKFL